MTAMTVAPGTQAHPLAPTRRREDLATLTTAIGTLLVLFALALVVTVWPAAL